MSSTPKKIKLSREIEAVDIPTMFKMSDEEYRKFLQGDGLFFIDHNALRSSVADYPLATTREQLNILIEELQRRRGELQAVRGDLQELELSIRTQKALESGGIDSIEQLSEKTARQLPGIKDFGKKALNEVTRALSKRGITIGLNLGEDNE
jgi:DNA-directed RNA polymerase alpha subunit